MLKLSGEAFAGQDGDPIDGKVAEYVAHEIVDARELGVDIAVVVGGGNIWRGLTGTGEAWSRQDEMGRVLDLLTDRLCPALVGARIDCAADVQRIAGAYREEIERDAGWPLAASVSAIDLALWDLWARESAEPLWKALGGASD